MTARRCRHVPVARSEREGIGATHADDIEPPEGDDDLEDGDGLAMPSHVFFENEALIRALNDPRRGEGEGAVAQRLFGALVKSTLIALVPEALELELGDDGLVEEDLEVSFVLVRHPEVEGEIVPMFTDEGAVTAFSPDGGRYIALSVRDLFPLLASGKGGPPNIVINPGSDEALLLTPRMVQDIVDAVRGYSLEVVNGEGPVVVGLPNDPLDDASVAELARVLSEHADILRCLELQWFMPERHDAASLVLALEIDEEIVGGARRNALTAVWAELSPLLRRLDRTVEMVDLDAQRERFGDLVERARVLFDRTAG